MDRNPYGTQNYIPSRSERKKICRILTVLRCIGRNFKQHTYDMFPFRGVCTLSVCVQTLLPRQVVLYRTGCFWVHCFSSIVFLTAYDYNPTSPYPPRNWNVPREYPIPSFNLHFCGSGMFIPDPTFSHPGSRIRIFCIPDPRQRI